MARSARDRPPAVPVELPGRGGTALCAQRTLQATLRADAGRRLPDARLRRLVLLIVALVCHALPAHAQTPSEPTRESAAEPTRESAAEPTLDPGVLPTLAALGPGFFLHGPGTFLAGDRPAAKRLLISGAVGFSTFFVSGALIAGTGTARGLVGIATPFVIAGAGTFLLGWLADVYGAATGGRNVQVAPFLPWVEAELGYRYVHDPQFAYGSFVEARSHLRVQRFRASPSAIVALDDDNQRLSLELAHRTRGRVPGDSSRDGSYLEPTASLTYHRYGSERFSVWTPALALEGRLDLAHVGASLRGAFVDGQLGAGLELYNFDVQGTRARESSFAVLLARFAFGVYLRGSGVRGGEATLYYDHRHDDFAAGLGVRGIGSGVLGHLGAAGHYYFSEHWGGALMFEVGSAVVTSLTLRYRGRQP